ncbi:efflux RND transporter permease subunit, partial [Burkholderia cenocepacia]|nr:efflux RND transporter permease subunit [Burkholderia cenocepacia]
PTIAPPIRFIARRVASRGDTPSSITRCTLSTTTIAIREVVLTLVEAVVLVFCVMWLFLRDLRYTLVPTVVIPVTL